MRHCHVTFCYTHKHCFFEHIMVVLKSLLKPTSGFSHKQPLLPAFFSGIWVALFCFVTCLIISFLKTGHFRKYIVSILDIDFSPASRACFLFCFCLCIYWLTWVYCFSAFCLPTLHPSAIESCPCHSSRHVHSHPGWDWVQQGSLSLSPYLCW